jgi:SAM-dependent methyltransferase
MELICRMPQRTDTPGQHQARAPEFCSVYGQCLMDNYIHIPLTIKNLDKYVHRKAILSALQESLPLFSGTLLDYGCGKMPYKKYIVEHSAVTEYIGLDIETALDYGTIKPDVVWDGTRIPFPDGRFDIVFATEVFEHVHDLYQALLEIHRVLKSEGLIFFTLPFVWPLHEVPNDEYRYTPFALEKNFKRAGFTQTDIQPTGGWNAALAQLLGLWVRRKPMSKKKKTFLSFLMRPVIRALLRGDSRPFDFREKTMMPGLYGIARK